MCVFARRGFWCNGVIRYKVYHVRGGYPRFFTRKTKGRVGVAICLL